MNRERKATILGSVCFVAMMVVIGLGMADVITPGPVPLAVACIFGAAGFVLFTIDGDNR